MNSYILPQGQAAQLADRLAPRLADGLARGMLLLQSFGHAMRMPSPGVPEATAQLLRLAESYEATQPSYASDLRAAASMADRNGFSAD
ncbi:MAG TPA: hypothetical protein PLX45_15490 [Piscinibacter sp.]|jgi:hypothetical protein|uniref:hypothetical protein n=1 Tax=Piscinibacter sp. TaxID=1903157 RepID=UPI001B688E06|nr:hypothetical protein [Piscinibacter sp.]MBK7533498.1 hypothetical protein [Piscinibacter sp.]MBP6541701.1 hypothetical protein [Piscinibacter sp.]HOY35417.1 hypothetical protein [Piscinibacter sp.]HPG80151.1 hypothetical protein [Piscinibacter sp.]HPM67663.1 hypothetical protein [Piscinibacter sp.]